MTPEKPLIETLTRTIGTAGHVDHGKTSLAAALTGMDTDRLGEEKRRGVSIDLGFAHLDIEKGGRRVRAALVDVPGHERFIKNMLAGTTGIDLVLFVVAADDGVMPQTREHLDIVRLLGIERAVFVITKSDLVDEDRVEEVRKEVGGLIESTPLEGSPFVAFSAATGEGLEGVRRALRDALFQPAEGASKEGYFRLPVDRSFAAKGFGTVVTGTIAEGVIRKGDEVVIFPTGQAVKVRGIQTTRLEAEAASAGQRAALNLSGVGHRDIKRGCVLASPSLAPLVSVRSRSRAVDCLFEFTAPMTERRPASNRLFKLHHQADETLAAIQLHYRNGLSEKTGWAWGRLILRKPLLMMRGDRFILRDPSINATVGGGVVFAAYLSREAARGVTRTAFPETADLKTAKDDAEALKTLLAGRPAFDKRTLALMLNLSDKRLDRLVAGFSGAVAGGGYVAEAGRAAALDEAVKTAIAEFHKERPEEAGMGEDAARAAVRPLLAGMPGQAADGLFKEILSGLVAKGAAAREGRLLRLAAHRSALTGQDGRIEEALLKLLSGSIKPPLPEEIGALGFKKEDVARVLAYLHRGGAVVRIKDGAWVSASAMEEAREKLSAFIKAHGVIKAADFRDLLGCGRKLAIEILEYFDRERVTLRSGDERTLR